MSEIETVMAVCAEWRDCIESADPSVWNDKRIAGLVETTKAQQLAYLARIEAAWRRERSEIEANALAVGGIVEAARERHEREAVTKCNHIGNAAAMREALEKVRFYLPYFLQYMRLHWEDAGAGGYYESILEVVNAALAKQPRNCDLFSIYSEAEDYWHENVECADVNGCFDVWLFEPAAERKGEGDGR